MEKQKFEDKWKDAFREASVTPSEKVWSNIELELERDGLAVAGRRMLYYKLVAAASLIFALCAGATGLYYFDRHKADQLSLRKEIEEAKKAIAELKQARVEEIAATTQPATTTEINGSDRTIGASSSVSKRSAPTTVANTPTTVDYSASVTFQKEDEPSLLQAGNILSPKLVKIPAPALKIPEQKKQDVDPVQLMLARLSEREQALSAKNTAKRSNTGEDLWTSVGLAAGSFNSTGTTVSPTSTNQALRMNNTIANNEANASGVSYTVGVNVGTKVGDRWVVQGGFNYMNQTSNYTAETVVGSADFNSFTPASTNTLQRFNSNNESADDLKLIQTAPYNVNNNIRYLNLPLQAGYLLVDKKIGLQLNAGVSTDFFLSNLKTAEGPQLEKIEENNTDDSPYRTMNFSGLIGSEISYRFSNRYRVAFNPGLRYPFNSIYKSNLGVQSAPISFDLGLRFRYIFE